MHALNRISWLDVVRQEMGADTSFEQAYHYLWDCTAYPWGARAQLQQLKETLAAGLLPCVTCSRPQCVVVMDNCPYCGNADTLANAEELLLAYIGHLPEREK